jgi:hypothetical protein
MNIIADFVDMNLKPCNPSKIIPWKNAPGATAILYKG